MNRLRRMMPRVCRKSLKKGATTFALAEKKLK